MNKRGERIPCERRVCSADDEFLSVTESVSGAEGKKAIICSFDLSIK